MFINGTEIIQTEKNNKIIVSVITIDKRKEYIITPNVISEAWLLHNGNQYDLIKEKKGWKADIYNYLISRKIKNKEPNIILIALLLSCKL